MTSQPPAPAVPQRAPRDYSDRWLPGDTRRVWGLGKGLPSIWGGRLPLGVHFEVLRCKSVPPLPWSLALAPAPGGPSISCPRARPSVTSRRRLTAGCGDPWPTAVHSLVDDRTRHVLFPLELGGRCPEHSSLGEREDFLL